MKSKASELVLLAISLIGLLALFSLIFIFFGVYNLWTISYKTDDWKDIGDYMNGIGAPVVSLWTLFITGWIAYEFNQYQKSKQNEKDRNELTLLTIQLYKEFRSQSGLTTRNLALNIWHIWRQNDNFLPEFVDHMIKEKEFEFNGTRITRDHIQAVFDFISFYNMLSLHGVNNENIKNLNYFHYSWWRSFLYAIAFLYDEKREKILLPNDKFDMNFRAEFIGNVSMGPSLKRLDKLCGFHVLNYTGSKNDILEFYDGVDYC